MTAETYDLEYGIDSLEIHHDALEAGERVLIIDDVLATGGTAAATAGWPGRLGATWPGSAASSSWPSSAAAGSSRTSTPFPYLAMSRRDG